MFKAQRDALGERAKSPGRERAVYSGDLADDRGNIAAVQIALQQPGLAAAQGLRPEGAVLKFDGRRPAVAFPKAEEAFLESFTADTVEALLDAERNGTAIRSLGFNFKSKTETPGHPEPRYDIYQATLTSKTKTDTPKVTKLFWFDTATHLLMRTTYQDGETKVETKFSDWGTSDGSKHPSRVERFENGNRVFAFTAKSVTAGPKVDEAGFRP
jgi:hypothetical protein